MNLSNKSISFIIYSFILLSIHPSMHPSIHPPIHPTHLYIFAEFLSLHLYCICFLNIWFPMLLSFHIHPGSLLPGSVLAFQRNAQQGIEGAPAVPASWNQKRLRQGRREIFQVVVRGDRCARLLSSHHYSNNLLYNIHVDVVCCML